MMSEGNNGYIRSEVMAEQGDLLPTGSRECSPSEASLQVKHGPQGATTTILHRPGISRGSSITRHRGPIHRQQFITVLAIILLVIAALTLFLVIVIRECNQEAHPKLCLTEECVRTAASLLSAMNQTASPCEDFFQYACGTWNRLHVIPEDKSSISTFEVMADQLQVILKRVLEEPLNNQDNEATMKAKMFYKSCMDIPQIRKIGDEPLRKVLKSLGGWPAVEGSLWRAPPYSVEVLLGRLRSEFNEGVLFEQWVGPDDKNSSMNILQASLPEVDRHDTSSVYRKLKLRELQREVPQIKWRDYLQECAPISEEEPLVAYAMPYLVEMGKIIAKTDRRTLHNYILWRFVMSITPHMIDEYQQKRIEFRKILLGILTERARWSQCVEWTNKKLGMAVGALFIRDNFNHESKETALQMIQTIREAFNDLLIENQWMDDETRAVAKNKADSMNERIGYPEFLKDPKKLAKEYLTLSITGDRFLENILWVLKYDAYQNLQRLRQPVDKEKWSTEPAVVNAFYNPNNNDIVFPAGILQPLFYSQHFPKSLNYGGIGVVIGHEITHGFDDKGRQFDKDGNMMQWWNNATIRAFRERTQCIVDQYSRYKLQEVDLYVNGRMTQGENIADNGGLKQSFRAYKKWTASHGQEPFLPGVNLNHDQLFFLNYAQIWCGTMRPEDARTKVRSSVHSPGRARVLGPLSNSVDFARAYSCPPGSPMNPTHKCSVW
ncbi:neprilysin-1-like [Belonocnema kinseyi]|uniref:neprilysin-1-like n=1 Tax=Belonocnema kinseyi TaxID=2817044 RepID=UPI00143D52E7|nr:neprilysin-1-like [Belonocnema kinseyi]